MITLVAPDPVEEEMKFTVENQNWIKDEIRSALELALKGLTPPRGWRKAVFFLREWSILAAVPALMVTLLILALTQYSAANKRLADDAVVHTTLTLRLNGIEEKLKNLGLLLASSQPKVKLNQETAKEILAEARGTGQKLPTETVEQAGKSFVNAAATEPRAWAAALDLIAYRTTLNPIPPTHGTGGGTVRETADTLAFGIAKVPGRPSPILREFAPFVPRDKAAILGPIGFDPNATVELQPSKLSAEGGSVSLDGMQMRNVSFVGAEVHYAGGPVILENVAFVNCIFVFDNTPTGRRLGESVLADTQVSFTSDERGF